MRELDKNYVYSLEELTSEELRELWIYLTKVDEDWADCPFEEMIIHQKKYRLFFNTYNWSWRDSIEPIHNAKELFYTLENIQVDCSELSDEQIKGMADVFESNGYKIWDDNDALMKETGDVLRVGMGIEFYINYKNEKFTTITYEKFMELFAEPEYEVKYIAEEAKEYHIENDLEMIDKPKHYANGIDTFARMEANCTLEECLAFVKGNIDKYNFRTKGQDLEDYTKIIAYANWAIKLLNKK